jgi:hypothetical protein
MNVRVIGPHVDVKGSQSQPYRVTLLDPGRLVEVHRFPDAAAAEAFAEQQRVR